MASLQAQNQALISFSPQLCLSCIVWYKHYQTNPRLTFIIHYLHLHFMAYSLARPYIVGRPHLTPITNSTFKFQLPSVTTSLISSRVLQKQDQVLHEDKALLFLIPQNFFFLGFNLAVPRKQNVLYTYFGARNYNPFLQY